MKVWNNEQCNARSVKLRLGSAGKNRNCHVISRRQDLITLYLGTPSCLCPQFYIQLVYKASVSFTLRIKNWVAAYRTLFFANTKLKKTTSKVAQKYSKLFLPYWNPTIFNMICWLAGSLGRTTHWLGTKCLMFQASSSFTISYRLSALKTLLFFVELYKK